MENDILARLTRLPDAKLVEEVKTLIGRERGVTAEVIAHLAELDTRDVHLREGHPSLFAYCRDALGLSEWEAYNRIEVARAARRFPVVLQLLGEGAVHLTAVRRLAPHLTPANHLDVLESVRGKAKNEVEEIVARLAPRPDVPCSVRRVSKGPTASAQGVIVPAGAGAAGTGARKLGWPSTLGCSRGTLAPRIVVGRVPGGRALRRCRDAALARPLQAPADDQRRNAGDAAPGQRHAGGHGRRNPVPVPASQRLRRPAVFRRPPSWKRTCSGRSSLQRARSSTGITPRGTEKEARGSG